MLKERAIKVILFLCAAFSIFAVLSIIGYLLFGSMSIIGTFFLHGINVAFSGAAASVGTGPVVIEEIDGTIFTALGGTALAVCIGLPTAIYMAEFADMRLRNFAKTSLEVLDGFPSVVIGIIGFGLLVTPNSKYTFTHIIDNLQTSQHLPTNECIFFAWLILMIMSVPVIATLSEDALRSVPNELREASLGLGATRWQTTREVLLPTAMSRIVTSILLALAAAMGEMVAINWVLRGTVASALIHNPVLILNPVYDTLTLSIAMENGYAAAGDLSATVPASVFALGFLVFVIVGVVNISARALLANRSKTATE
jgi:ABC-type phosphate transport system permease subunit